MCLKLISPKVHKDIFCYHYFLVRHIPSVRKLFFLEKFSSSSFKFSISAILLLAAEKQGCIFDKLITFIPLNKASTVDELL